MNSPHEFSSTTEGLRAYLERSVPNSQVTDVPADSPNSRLLLLQTPHTLAAFAFSNGDVRTAYEVLYQRFKTLYSERRDKWDTLDLAFVYCVRPDAPDLDRFCSNVETDVLFCRKFVVPLAEPLGDVLARLPFLPLVPLHGQSFRPPSAQTYLQQCGVPASLAKIIVVQRERSPEGIIEDCISGKYGPPRTLTKASNAPITLVDRNVAPVQLEKVVISNFRAYRKPQTFNIGPDVTVLYGPNGFGKTSFFDAIDFAFTGDIGRIKATSEAHFKKTAQHLDCKSDESNVLLSFAQNSIDRQLVRQVSDRRQATLDGQPADRKTILAQLTGGDTPGADRVENFVNLFRATHLFSQEHQELAKGFETDCELSGQVVSRMLAFEDYANAATKTLRVRELMGASIRFEADHIDELSRTLDSAKKELERLDRMAQVHTNVAVLDSEISSLREKLDEIGISASTGQPDAAMARGWRASVEARYAESQNRTGLLTDLLKEVAGLRQWRADIASLQQQIMKIDHELLAVDEQRTAAEAALQIAEREFGETNRRRLTEQERASALEWVRTMQPVYIQSRAAEKHAVDERIRAVASLEQQRTSEEKAAGELETLENLAARAAQVLVAKRYDLGVLQNLIETANTWVKNRARLSELAELEQVSIRSLESLREEEGRLSEQIGTTTLDEGRLSREVAEADRGQSELRKLLSQLQSHVNSSICPLCGQEYGSRDDLLQRIQEHVASDAASKARVDLARLRDSARGLTEKALDNKRKKEAVDSQLVSIRNERDRLGAEIAQLANAAARFGILVEATKPFPTAQLESMHAQVREEITEIERQAPELQTRLSTARMALADLRESVSTEAVEVANKEKTLARLQGDIGKLRADPRLTQISLDIEPTALAQLEEGSQKNLAELTAQAGKFEEEAVQKRSRVSALSGDSTSLKAQLSAARVQLASLQRRVSQVVARLSEAKLQPDIDEGALLDSIKQESQLQAKYSALRDLASAVELAIDAATTAAALAGLQVNVRNTEEEVSAAAQKRDHLRSWLKYFESLSELVSSQQGEAISTFTGEYGPRTSVIQRRLRAVYGFDEIEILNRGSAIAVRVKRHGEELRPTDYFSQSQQQTLLLSLFLTACLSQTWSTLSPIFLDDPVTHFDDLNCYAFLDLIVGLIESGSGKRQFVVSTCDDKFMQLARQKFRYLGARAKFYGFSAIGAEGPVVNEIASG